MQRFVILGDYGGPVTDDQVRPYLKRLFSDPLILDVPGFVRAPLSTLISSLRARKARGIYRSIDGSPVNETVSGICRKLNEEQSALRFVPGFQYIEPLLFRVAQGLAMTGASRVLVLPTFPHDSFSTYGSMRDAVDGLPGIGVARPYFDDETFLGLLEKKIWETVGDWPTTETAIICTAHSVPVSYVDKGDVYVSQVEQQMEFLREKLNGYWVELAYQSPIGPVKWVGPFLEDRVKALADQGIKRLVVVPLSFTVDNSETCYELDMEVKALAGTMGITAYRRVPCLNDDPDFCRFLLRKAKAELENPDVV